MLFNRSIFTTLTSLIVIILFFFSINNLTNCEPIIRLSPLSLGDKEQTTIDLLDQVGNVDVANPDDASFNLLITAQSDDQLSNGLSPSAIDIFPFIHDWQSCDEKGEIYVPSVQKCLKKKYLFDNCIASEQCIVPQSECIHQECRCRDYFADYSRNKCTPVHNTAIEIYKITMIFASSCLALILLIFLACILRKSYCPTDSSHQGTGRSAINDLFTIYPGTSGSPNDLFSNLTPAEKPPSYSETMRMINQEVGTPPPAYHNIFYTETSSTSTTEAPTIVTTTLTNNNSNITVNCNNQQPPVTSSSQSINTNANNGSLLLPATSSTINAQNCNLYSLSQRRSIVQHPSAPSVVTFNQGQVNSAFSSDS